MLPLECITFSRGTRLASNTKLLEIVSIHIEPFFQFVDMVRMKGVFKTFKLCYIHFFVQVSILSE